MFDLITYCKNSKAFLKEVQQKFPDKVIYDESDPPVAIGVSITKTPTIKNTKGTLAVVRCDAKELADIKSLKSIKILAEVPMGGDLLGSMTKANRKIYDSIHDQKPKPVLDEKGKPMKDKNGKKIMFTPPALIGSFA